MEAIAHCVVCFSTDISPDPCATVEPQAVSGQYFVQGGESLILLLSFKIVTEHTRWKWLVWELA
jgi:hypothetical protein